MTNWIKSVQLTIGIPPFGEPTATDVMVTPLNDIITYFELVGNS